MSLIKVLESDAEISFKAIFATWMFFLFRGAMFA
jgi:hypothetical protein